MIDSCEKFVTEAGLDLCDIKTDQGSNFSKAFKNLGCTVKNPIIKINGKNIIILPDVPHILKSTRNIIHNGNTINTAEGVVCWSHIRKTFNLNFGKSFSLIPKVTELHIYLPPFEGKMSVKLASQVFSNTMSATMYTLIEKMPYP